MRFWIVASMIASGTSLASPAVGQAPDDLARAHEQLKDGFALRKAGRCAEALPRFLESLRLAPQPKALLNLADCEERLGHFIAAEGHWGRARDMAEAQGSTALKLEAADRLAELAPRMPRLTIALAPGAPPSSHVVRDGVDFAPASLGVPLPCDGGRHTIEVRAEGYEPKVFEVALSERDTTRIDVEPGPRWQPSEIPPSAPSGPPARGDTLAQAPASAPTHPPEGTPPVREIREPGRTGHDAPIYVGFGSGALGVAGLAFGIVEGLASANDHRGALNACNGACGSSPLAQSDQASAQSAATLANVGFVAGGALIATGIALLIIHSLTSSSAHPAVSFRATRFEARW